MGSQVQGITGLAVDRMVRRAVRKSFHSVQWLPPKSSIATPTILVPNHHGWHDGYLMYLAATQLGIQVVDWIQEFDSFPLFSSIGGMPFPADSPARRASTIRQTIRRMNAGETSLILFAEGVLHRPPGLLPFGKSLELVASKVAGVSVVPVAIRYEHSMHERPEAFVSFGGAVELGPDLCRRTRLAVSSLLDRLKVEISFNGADFQTLSSGTPDVNERFDFRSSPWGRHLHR